MSAILGLTGPGWQAIHVTSQSHTQVQNDQHTWRTQGPQLRRSLPN